MTEELFRGFWWLMFPIFGMVMAILGTLRERTHDERVLREARQLLERRP